jgi:hypothetical protein
VTSVKIPCNSHTMAHSSICKPRQQSVNCHTVWHQPAACLNNYCFAFIRWQIFAGNFQFSLRTETLPSSKRMAPTYQTSRWHNKKAQHSSTLIICPSSGIRLLYQHLTAALSVGKHDHTRSHTITQDHTGPHTITHDHTRSRTITHDHTGPHTITHDHSRSHRSTHDYTRSRSHTSSYCRG